MKVAVLGASPNKDRYSNRAIHALQAKGHDVVPVNPAHDVIEGLPVARSLKDVTGAVDTVTVYVSPFHIGPLIPDLLALRPRRVIAETPRSGAVAAGTWARRCSSDGVRCPRSGDGGGLDHGANLLDGAAPGAGDGLQAVGDGLRQYGLHVVGSHIVTPGHQGPRLGRPQHRHARAR